MNRPYFSVLDTVSPQEIHPERAQYRVVVLSTHCHDHEQQPYTQYWVITDPSITSIKDDRVLSKLKDVLSPHIQYSVTTTNRVHRAQFYECWNVVWITPQNDQYGHVNIRECQDVKGVLDCRKILLSYRTMLVVPPIAGSVYKCENNHIWYYHNRWYRVTDSDSLLPEHPGCMVEVFKCQYGNWLQKAHYLRQWL